MRLQVNDRKKKKEKKKQQAGSSDRSLFLEVLLWHEAIWLSEGPTRKYSQVVEDQKNGHWPGQHKERQGPGRGFVATKGVYSECGAKN